MKKGLFILTIFTVLTLINNINAYCQDWNYIGFSKLNNDTIFYVFSMKKKDMINKNIVFVQKHLFGKPQKLDDGREYNSVLMDRTLDCGNKSISIDKITISNGIGNKVETYINRNNITFDKIENENKIDSILYEQYCI